MARRNRIMQLSQILADGYLRLVASPKPRFNQQKRLDDCRTQRDESSPSSAEDMISPPPGEALVNESTTELEN